MNNDPMTKKMVDMDVLRLNSPLTIPYNIRKITGI